MCGIAGIAGGDTEGRDRRAAIGAMTDRLEHRGPDDRGLWIDDEAGVALGHRRLSILDLSPLGHQPMHSQNDRYSIVFNGEIYNFKDLQAQLTTKGHNFRGGSDTEVMLAAIEEWGFEDSIKKFTGMFAFALWDKKQRILYLARDRIGKKPLYYGWNNGIFLFASELKALKSHPRFISEIDRSAAGLALKYGYIPAPWSIYKGIFKLYPGTTLALNAASIETKPSNFSPFPDSISGTSPKSYWKLISALRSGLENPYRGSFEDASDELEKLLMDSVKIRMLSDVPLGAFLSGGIDSTTIVALMQVQSKIPVKSFAIGFEEDGFNEAAYAKKVADYLKLDHTELYVKASDALNVIPSLPVMFDEPFSDSSQIPTYLVSKLCRDYVTVGLSGDGGDELFGGYSRYPWALKTWKNFNKIPRPLKKSLVKAVELVPAKFYEALFSGIFKNPAHKFETLGRVMSFETRSEFYDGLMSHWEGLVIGNGHYHAAPGDPKLFEGEDFLTEMMFTDMLTYLPDDIMVKVDRASMAVSLETRAPFLDHRVIEFSWRLPAEYKLNNSTSKRILRNILHRHVPADFVERPKMGFSIPLADWLRGPLRSWGEELIDEKKLEQQGYLNKDLIHNKWRQHQSGKHDWAHSLWDILMFQSWLECNS
jgi:asparagine synthase (glutamine-hydrolysing)